jgi:hypothetical protein
MSNVKTRFSFFAFALACSFLASCAWDNSPPPYHTVIHYDPSRAQPFASNIAPANAPSTRDWKTNQVVGVGYGSAGPVTPTTSGQAVGGAASTPSGVSSGGASGTAIPAPASSTPGTIIGNPPGTGIIGTSPIPTPTATPGPTTSPAISPLSPTGPTSTTGTGPNLTTPFSVSPQSPTFTNTGSGALFTNSYTAPTNSFSNPELSVPRP